MISEMLLQEGLLPESPLVFYEGDFELQTVDKLIEEVGDQANTQKFSARLKKKVFNIGIEVLDNLFHHLQKAHLSPIYKAGLFTMYEADGSLYLMTGNFIDVGQVNGVTSRISMINALSPEERTTLYRGVLDIGSISNQGGAGLGFIDISRKSGNPLGYHFIKVDAVNSFFVLKIKINE